MNQKVKPAAPKLVKFKTAYSADSIEQVEVLRETAQCVFLPPYRSASKAGKTERREAKHGEFAQYHDTWTSAHAYLLDKAADKVLAARDLLKRANDKIGNIKGMKPPKDGA